jgi:chromosome segregation protein
MSELVTRADELRQRIDRMGPVNVLAVEQAQELEERHRFLTAQRQDLVDSIKELDDAIRKIDRSSRERFKEAFQIINEHFGRIFKQLFGGGTAGLSLIDEEDILESGIDVMAQPPGKRLQSVMLLSGGEKALTAIALLFAIFQYKPSPFCILDEVDAPLDDANIGRFVRMLDGLKGQTQFVLITHSRRTMEIADQLYGVTMEEPGVSKLVSVRFQ